MGSEMCIRDRHWAPPYVNVWRGVSGGARAFDLLNEQLTGFASSKVGFPATSLPSSVDYSGTHWFSSVLVSYLPSSVDLLLKPLVQISSVEPIGSAQFSSSKCAPEGAPLASACHQNIQPSTGHRAPGTDTGHQANLGRRKPCRQFSSQLACLSSFQKPSAQHL